MKNNLRDHYKQHQGKLSDKWSSYLDAYERLFADYRDRKINLLEIGIQNGGSLEIWSQYFSRAKSLIGCDINPDCLKLTYIDGRIRVVVGDANTYATEQVIRKHAEQFDIIIDDGSHTSGDIVKSFARYFKLLTKGGLFVVEDLHCSYWQEFEGGLFYPYSSVSFFKTLADIINHQHWGDGRTRRELLRQFSAHFSVNFDESDLAQIHSVEFLNSICVIRKKDAAHNVLGDRMLVGSSQNVVDLRQHGVGSTLSVPAQGMNGWTAMRMSPAEGWQSLQQALAERDKLIAEIYASKSWKVTKPLRWIVRQLKRMRRATIAAREALHTEGLKSTLSKARGIYQREGVRGLLERLRTNKNAYSSAQVRNEKAYAKWLRLQAKSADADQKRMAEHIEAFPNLPKISVILPVYDPPIRFLDEAIWSVRNQVYPEWELCIADDASPSTAVRELLQKHASADARIKLILREENGHISTASNTALAVAVGEFVALLDHDDRLHSSALYEVANAIVHNKDVDLIYSDEDKLDGAGRRVLPFVKPDWSPHLAISQAYLGHLTCFRTELVKSLGGWRSGVEGAQDYDLTLRASHSARKIHHIPKILYHWRTHDNSTSQNPTAKPYATRAGLVAVNDYLIQRYPGVQVSAAYGDYPFTYRATFNLPADARVTIIVPTRDKVELLQACVRSILGSSWENIEILIVDNGSRETETLTYLKDLAAQEQRIRVVAADIPFNWSRLNNIAAAEASGDVLVFLNNDTVVKTHDWLQYLAGYARLPDAGVVGALLFFEDGTIQHSGVVVGMGGWADHVYRASPAVHSGAGPFVSPVITRNVLAVTGACMAITREKFEQLGGFDEEFEVCGSDVELCLRAYKAGLWNIMCADVQLFHLESKTRSPHIPDGDFVQSKIKYAPYREGMIDPFFSPNLSLAATTPSLAGGEYAGS